MWLHFRFGEPISRIWQVTWFSSDETFTLTDGLIELNGITAPSGTITDRISFTYTTTIDPGATYTVEGYRYTGWAEDM